MTRDQMIAEFTAPPGSMTATNAAAAADANIAAIARSDNVNAALAALSTSDPATFDVVRCLPYESQAAHLGL